MTPPYPIHDVELLDVLDIIDPPYWSIFRCNVVLEDGRTITDCEVQSDGYTIAYETLADEQGNPLSYIL